MKTPEEIKAGLRCHAVQWHAGECPDHEPGCKGCPYENDYHDPDELMTDALELIEELEKQVPQWISVKDRLPEESEDVLVFCRNDNITWNTIAHRVRTLWWRSGVPIESITHWMLLPEPPKEDEHETSGD